MPTTTSFRFDCILFILVVAACIALYSCKQADGPEPQTIKSAMKHFPAFDLQGHRGARGILPENTVPSLLIALEYGITTLEFDLVVTADSQIILSHEPWFHHHISSHPDGSPITLEESMELNIFQMTYDEVAQYDVGMRGHVNFPEQQPMPAVKPLLSEAILAVEGHIREHNLPEIFYNIETKSHPDGYGLYVPHPETFARLLYDELKGLGVLHRSFIQSFDVNTLIEMREIDPEVALVLLVENSNGLEWNLEQLGFVPDVYSPNFRLVDRELVNEVHKRGMKIVPWTINQKEDMLRMVEAGVDGIITDYPNRAVELREIRELLGMEN